ncbi:MAG: TIGR03618 family F420-dependent PPOX class oxidoreductase [Chloroflexota bacterium]
MEHIPDSHADLLRDEARAFAYLATIMPDGSPQVTPVWFNTEGDLILLNSAKGRTKDRNMRSRPEVALLIADPKDPLRYLQVRGRIVGITEAGALEHIGTLSMKYRGRPWTPVSGQTRAIYKLLPDRVSRE